MNAIEEIEAQLRRSVAALNPGSIVASAEHGHRHWRPAGWPTAARSSRLLRAGALAVIVAAALVVFGVFTSGPTVGPTPAVAAVLRHLAQIAAHGPSLVPGPGRYLYLDSTGRGAEFDGLADGKACITYSIWDQQTWIAADGSGLSRGAARARTFTSPRDRALCLATESRADFDAVGASNTWFADRCFQLGPTNDMQALSTNPRILLRQMRRIDGGPRTAAEDFVHIGDFLRGTDARPALRAALYRAAALIPGVRLLGPVRDHDGRRGLGVAFTSHGERNELIFNPRTAALLGEQSSGKAPGENSWTVYRASRVVSSLPYPSPVPLTSPCHRGAGYISDVRGGTVMMGRRVR